MDAKSSSDSPCGLIGEPLSEKASDTPSSRLGNHLTLDTHSNVSRNSASTSPATASQTPDFPANQTAAPSAHVPLRTLPAWIQSVEEHPDEEEDASPADRLLPSEPNDARVAQHNHSPYAKPRPENSSGQYEYNDRSPSPDRESRWKTFSRTIQYPREPGSETQQVTPEWLDENMGNYSGPWRGTLLEGDTPEFPLHTTSGTRREIWFKRFHSTLLRSAIVPLIFRLTVWCFSLSALALGGSIQHMSDEDHHRNGPSALMAIIVDAVALVYLVYITFDEFSSKPLGLRPPLAKARLILLDLFFIVFDSANLSLAFNSLNEVTGSCTESEVNARIDPRNNSICTRQKALASVLLVALIAWLMTFAISVLR
ncbi:hypothetical protein N7468_002507 [Penicillium chermesinum]|uniref:Regulator of phospholipase D SRF1 n=1 Tax=Penicillium chermesinum TaxID=63820 RepID=A0A9W9TZM9_9EURO|nr:uncharacterized protein N7468_002507 [Penicillium chermesinum]KAJ5247524.1 hypothetical protein N7468_002507 [Penicillium chermesinum]KAJ6145761.1 hypothetical protein N7470_009656 [Penicillium chermesinum]